MLLAGLFFAGCGVVLAKVAVENDRGLIINGLIRFEPPGATIFYWVLTTFSVGFVVAAVLGLIRAFGPLREVVLDDASLSAPRGGLSGRITTVPLASIVALRVREVKRQRFVIVEYAGGKLTISGSMLPSSDDFETLVGEIERRRHAACDRRDLVPNLQPEPAEAAASRTFGRRRL